MARSMTRLFDALPTGEWVCWDRPPVMYVCYDSDGCSYYPMDTGVEARGTFPLFSWEFAMASDGRGGFFVTGGHDENRQVRVRDPYAVGHKEPFPDSFFGPMISELWHFEVRTNTWSEVEQEAWGPRQCVAARHMVYDPHEECLVRMGACREGHSPRPPVPLRGWGLFGFWRYAIATRRWVYMQPFETIGCLAYDTRRRIVLGCKDGRVGVYDPHSNTALLRPASRPAPSGEGAFAYDRAHDVALFVGESGETWTYDVEGNRWMQRKPRRSPRPRRGFAFALDPETGTGLLFGGRLGGSRRFDDTWSYDVETNAWTRIACAMRPEARFWWGPGMIFDEVNRAFVLHSGIARYRRVKARYAAGDVWVFRLPPRVGPGGRGLPAPDVRPACGPDADRADDQAGERSQPPRTDPAAPGLPVVSVLGRRRVDIAWPASPASDVVAYRLRRVRVIGEDRFTSEKIIEVGRRTRYRDAPPGLPARHYQYQVQAVNRLGAASGWSPSAGTIPSAPAKLVITPNAARRSIALRWPANPEKGIVGYNLYRWVEPPFRFAFKAEPELIVPAWWDFDEGKNPAERMRWVKVNDEPIAGTRYVDRGLRLVTAWYYIRAVNVLGVEGHYRTTYSMPVWRWYTGARRFF